MPLPLLQFVVAAAEDSSKPDGALKFWGGLIALVLVGIAFDSLPESAKLVPDWLWLTRLARQEWLVALLNKLGDAAIIAAVLAGAVDRYIKQKLATEIAREAVDFSVGYALPPPVKRHIRHILRTPLVRRKLVFEYEFSPASPIANAEDYLKVTCTTRYNLQNLTDGDMKFPVRTAVQKAHYPGLDDNKLCLLQAGSLRRSEPELKELAEKQASGGKATDILYTSVSEEVLIPHDIPSDGTDHDADDEDRGVPVVTRRVSYHRRDDDIFLDILPPPSLGLKLKVRGLRGYVVGASFGVAEFQPPTYDSAVDEWTWTVTDVVLPGSHLYFAWHPEHP